MSKPRPSILQCIEADIGRIESWYPHCSQAFFENYRESIHRFSTHGADQRFIQNLDLLDSIPNHPGFTIDAQGCIQIGDSRTVPKLKDALHTLKPWRKGPFRVFDQVIDAEWQSQVKWNRLGPHATELCSQKKILDIGSGNGYYMYQMAAQGAQSVLAVDRGVLQFYQYQFLAAITQASNLAYLRMAFQDLAPEIRNIDTIFSMGVLTHSRHPIEDLKSYKERLAPDGTLVLETIIIPGDNEESIQPERYANMKNVHILPSQALLQRWLSDSGYTDIQVLDLSQTSTTEQRSTPWSGPVSLIDALDPEDPNKSIEGHPAPRRILLLAT